MNVDELVIVDGNLMTVFGGRPMNPVFAQPEIVVTGTRQAKRATDDCFDFEFTLNTHTDSEWRDLFFMLPEMNCVSFSGSAMNIRCTEVALRGVYDKAREQMESTNRRYVQRRDEWLGAVKRHTAEEASKEERKTLENNAVPTRFSEFRI